MEIVKTHLLGNRFRLHEKLFILQLGAFSISYRTRE